LPTTDGTANQVLQTNGSGTLSFGTVASLSGTTDSASPFETSLGYQAGNVTTGVNNTFVGYQAGLLNSTGTNNTALGFKALDANTTGANNVAVGVDALGANTTANNNTAVGYQTLDANTTGYENTALGMSALGANTTGYRNVAVGHTSLFSNTTGEVNVALGQQSLYSNTTGLGNVALGYAALYSCTGSLNTSIGYQAGNNVTSGTNNIVIGSYADVSGSGASNEVTIGNTSITSTRLRGMVQLNAAMFEQATVSATAATGTINYDTRTQSVLYYTSNASANWTLNIRGASGVSLDSIMSTGQSLTIAFLVTNGSTAYYQSALQVDGSSVTPKWQGGTAPSAGNASSIDAYVITIIKTGSATFTALASQTKFA
jgi:hypothetical protein